LKKKGIKNAAVNGCQEPISTVYYPNNACGRQRYSFWYKKM